MKTTENIAYGTSPVLVENGAYNISDHMHHDPVYATIEDPVYEKVGEGNKEHTQTYGDHQDA